VLIYEDLPMEDADPILNMRSVSYNSEVDQFRDEEYPMLNGGLILPRLFLTASNIS
jgi:hypothetical protein